MTEASQNSELKFTHNTVNSLFTASRSPHTWKILFGPNCISNTNYTKLCIWNTKYILSATKIQNTKYMQCILNTYFKYLYFKYFTTLLIGAPSLRSPPFFYTGCPSWHNTPNLSWLGPCTKYAGLHTRWLNVNTKIKTLLEIETASTQWVFCTPDHLLINISTALDNI